MKTYKYNNMTFTSKDIETIMETLVKQRNCLMDQRMRAKGLPGLSQELHRLNERISAIKALLALDKVA